MKTSSLAICLALSVVTALGSAGPVTADEQVPFTGVLDGVATITPLDPPFVKVRVEAAGKATLLGKFDVVIPHVVNRTTFTARGRYRFTAANGDELYARFKGFSMPTDVPDVIAIEESATIVGGTGRFAGARGSFTAWRLFNRISGETTGYFEGSISRPND
jgi:hypothetical protein